MGIFNLFGKRDVSEELTKGLPYKIATEWVPYRLYSNRSSSCTLHVRIRNVSKEVLLTSVVAELPNNLAFEPMGISKEREVRVGELMPNEERDVKIEVHSNLNSDPGEYTLNLTAIAHYRNYGSILNAMKKRVTVSVV